MDLKQEFKKIDEYFDNISQEDLLKDLIDCGLKENMKNANNEEMSNYTFSVKSNEILTSIQDKLEDLPEHAVTSIVHKIIEYGVVQYRWALYEKMLY